MVITVIKYCTYSWPLCCIIIYLVILFYDFYLQLIYQRFYSTVSATDKCSLFADRNYINRRNVKADAHHAYAPNKQMFLLAVRSRIVASAMKILGMKKLEDSPTANHYPKDESRADKTMKRLYLRKLASQIVDKFIVDEKSYNDIVDRVLEDHDNQQERQAQMTPDGRFPCRQSGCNKTFRLIKGISEYTDRDKSLNSEIWKSFGLF